MPLTCGRRVNDSTARERGPERAGEVADYVACFRLRYSVLAPRSQLGANLSLSGERRSARTLSTAPMDRHS